MAGREPRQELGHFTSLFWSLGGKAEDRRSPDGRPAESRGRGGTSTEGPYEGEGEAPEPRGERRHVGRAVWGHGEQPGSRLEARGASYLTSGCEVGEGSLAESYQRPWAWMGKAFGGLRLP